MYYTDGESSYKINVMYYHYIMMVHLQVPYFIDCIHVHVPIHVHWLVCCILKETFTFDTPMEGLIMCGYNCFFAKPSWNGVLCNKLICYWRRTWESIAWCVRRYNWLRIMVWNMKNICLDEKQITEAELLCTSKKTILSDLRLALDKGSLLFKL